jgi:two-component system, OmpR family, response regulator VanR
MDTKRALICEDDAAIRSLVKTVVSREGFDVDLAVDGREGMKKIESGCYSVVIVDLMMPEVDGYAVIDFLKNRRPANLKRVIVMTAVSGALRTQFPEPVCTVLSKPFDVEQLATAVRNCARGCDD